ncbi:TldD/PmbA family protein [Myxococcus stipitatus DSM 14675]|uniref:TldD/PmbA family protein n=1 Tax=Myxococcus stipitatus (strain DSM 14675 / JCM 12634 / Mx s8) TaxID=1278073 RepID=L7U2R9_MYXSD|nr:metallopeptidase TldD-related protein [Myxococcus stipitatus]AGC43071.1 TldD/PmbA family protein [Myxococcus stipitatus DSM 14675]
MDIIRSLVASAHDAGAPSLDVLLREVERRTLYFDEHTSTQQVSRHAILELKTSVPAHGGSLDAWRAFAFPDLTQLHAQLPTLVQHATTLVRELRESSPGVPCPTGVLPIVFPPGAASACFFHEVCGHPLEGDVVARSGSYLARRLGQRVAGPWLSVSDDPTEGHGSLTLAWDDEGQPAQAVRLLSAGIVDAPLLDSRSACHLGHAPNGHGRRVSFRHPPLPRMAHTRVEPHEGDLDTLLGNLSHGLLVQHLMPRHMDLLSGDFSFYIVEAREVRDGRLGQRVSPGILAGNGLEALASIDAVGADARNLFATRGCRKLDHGPLPVSFGQPTVRFRGLHVRPAH